MTQQSHSLQRQTPHIDSWRPPPQPHPESSQGRSGHAPESPHRLLPRPWWHHGLFPLRLSLRWLAHPLSRSLGAPLHLACHCFWTDMGSALPVGAAGKPTPSSATHMSRQVGRGHSTTHARWNASRKQVRSRDTKRTADQQCFGFHCRKVVPADTMSDTLPVNSPVF